MQALRGRAAQTIASANVSARQTVRVVVVGKRAQEVACKAFGGMESDTLIIGGAVAALVGAAGFAYTRSQQQTADAIDTMDSAPAVPAAPKEEVLPRENAVLVLGATGRLGRRVVKQLLSMGRTVVAGVRSSDKAATVFSEMGVRAGRQEAGTGLLFVESGLDVTVPETLKRASLWKGVSQVMFTVGGVFGPLPGGGFGTIDNMTSERVEAEGIAAVMAMLPEYMKSKPEVSTRVVLPMASASDLEAWEKLDDNIMGGSSSSGLMAMPQEAGVQGAMWQGELIIEGGGFCGTRTKTVSLNFANTDGIHLRVRGDGSIFKMNIKTTDQLDTPESTYQTTFDTVAGQWSDVYMPWHSFMPVTRAQWDPTGTPLDASKIAKFGLVLSRFEFNKAPNPMYKPGPFTLEIEGGIRAYTAPRPQVVLISSAGVERNAIIADDDVARIKDIPIVQLNPGGTLNHKYAAEAAVRNSGYPYAVMRSTGMIDSAEGGPFLLEADQGDVIIGQVSRDEAAEALAQCVQYPDAAYKTFELRRNEAPESKGVRSMSGKDYTRMFIKLAIDRNRWRVGLAPFPKYTPPPPPVTAERTQEILAEVARIRGQAPAAPGAPTAAPAAAPAPAAAAPAAPAPAAAGAPAAAPAAAAPAPTAAKPVAAAPAAAAVPAATGKGAEKKEEIEVEEKVEAKAEKKEEIRVEEKDEIKAEKKEEAKAEAEKVPVGAKA